jgi:hypothetical protein
MAKVKDVNVHTSAQAQAEMSRIEASATAVLVWAYNARRSGKSAYSSSELANVTERADTIANKATALRRYLEGMGRGR